MKVVIAPDSFKESLSAPEVAAALAAGLRQVHPAIDIIEVPLADGGEGTLQVLASSGGVRIEVVEALNALGEPSRARLGVLDDGRRAIIEVAEVIGLQQVPLACRSPLRTSSYGVGQMMAAALDRGLQHVLVGLGGSATVDGGAGMMQALGARFFNRHGAPLAAPVSGGQLLDIAAVELDGLDARLATLRVEVASDVANPLCGARGAAAVFGPQKGASAADVEALDQGLRHLYDLLEKSFGRQVAGRAGAGAAGGLGAALLLAFDARLRPGVEVVMETLGLARHLRGATLVVTGEGRVDSQTLSGKAPAGVARLARELGVPIVAVGGSLQSFELLWRSGLFDAIEAAVTEPCSVEEALRDAASNLTRAGIRLGLWLALLSRLHTSP